MSRQVKEDPEPRVQTASIADCGCGPTAAAVALADPEFVVGRLYTETCHHCFKAIVATDIIDYANTIVDDETGELVPDIRDVPLVPECEHPTRVSDWRIATRCPHCGGGEPLLLGYQAHLEDLPDGWRDGTYDEAARLILATDVGEMNASHPGNGDAHLKALADKAERDAAIQRRRGEPIPVKPPAHPLARTVLTMIFNEPGNTEEIAERFYEPPVGLRDLLELLERHGWLEFDLRQLDAHPSWHLQPRVWIRQQRRDAHRALVRLDNGFWTADTGQHWHDRYYAIYSDADRLASAYGQTPQEAAAALVCARHAPEITFDTIHVFDLDAAVGAAGISPAVVPTPAADTRRLPHRRRSRRRALDKSRC